MIWYFWPIKEANIIEDWWYDIHLRIKRNPHLFLFTGFLMHQEDINLYALRHTVTLKCRIIWVPSQPWQSTSNGTIKSISLLQQFYCCFINNSIIYRLFICLYDILTINYRKCIVPHSLSLTILFRSHISLAYTSRISILKYMMLNAQNPQE